MKTKKNRRGDFSFFFGFKMLSKISKLGKFSNSLGSSVFAARFQAKMKRNSLTHDQTLGHASTRLEKNFSGFQRHKFLKARIQV